MKVSLLILLLLAIGCDRSRSGTFTVESQAGERFGRNMGDVQRMEFASSDDVNSLVSAMDWSTGKTRCHVSIVSFREKETAKLSIQHDLKAEQVHITAIWKPPEGASVQIATLKDQDSVLAIVKAYTNGGDVTEKADWREF